MALNLSQRRKRALTLRKFRTKIDMGRKRAERRIASAEMLEKRAHRAAIKIVRKIVAGKMGLIYDELSIPQKMMIDDKVHKKSVLVNKLARRMIPRLRQAEIARFKAYQKNQQVKESTDFDASSIENYLESMRAYYIEKYGDAADTIFKAVKNKVRQNARQIDVSDDD